jgi:hypothetical protein
MKIDFYEEFPKRENIEKLRLIKFKTRLFIAAKSLKEFKELEKKVRRINKKVECAYWPIIKNSYWISPFSNTQDLIDLFDELDKCSNHLLIDLELPLNKALILKNIFSYFINRKLIKDFLEKNQNRITTAQFSSSIISILMRILGLDYNVNIEKSFMWYSSMNSEMMNNNIKKNLIRLKNKNNYSISLGTIATGILGNEPILLPEDLEGDLGFVKKAGFNKIVIFRLGGLNKNYIKIINKFQNRKSEEKQEKKLEG